MPVKTHPGPERPGRRSSAGFPAVRVSAGTAGNRRVRLRSPPHQPSRSPHHLTAQTPEAGSAGTEHSQSGRQSASGGIQPPPRVHVRFVRRPPCRCQIGDSDPVPGLDALRTGLYGLRRDGAPRGRPRRTPPTAPAHFLTCTRPAGHFPRMTTGAGTAAEPGPPGSPRRSARDTRNPRQPRGATPRRTGERRMHRRSKAAGISATGCQDHRRCGKMARFTRGRPCSILPRRPPDTLPYSWSPD